MKLYIKKIKNQKTLLNFFPQDIQKRSKVFLIQAFAYNKNIDSRWRSFICFLLNEH